MCRIIGSIVISSVILPALLFTAYTTQTSGPTPSPIPSPIPASTLVTESESENPVVIGDLTGRLQDITHARDVYDMNPNYFNYGLGIGVIHSIDDPAVLEEGGSGYPNPDSSIQVFGASYHGEQRAYSVSALTRYEVINDVYPGEPNQYVSVTY
ncbi:hypothetical protein ACFLTP_00150 [Chloroflexota bacterium]